MRSPLRTSPSATAFVITLGLLAQSADLPAGPPPVCLSPEPVPPSGVCQLPDTLADLS